MALLYKMRAIAVSDSSYVFWTDFQPADLGSERFSGFVQSWKNLVDAHVAKANSSAGSNETDITKLSISKLVGSLTLSQIWAALGIAASVLTSVAATAYKLGGGRWPWE